MVGHNGARNCLKAHISPLSAKGVPPRLAVTAALGKVETTRLASGTNGLRQVQSAEGGHDAIRRSRDCRYARPDSARSHRGFAGEGQCG